MGPTSDLMFLLRDQDFRFLYDIIEVTEFSNKMLPLSCCAEWQHGCAFYVMISKIYIIV